MQSWLRIGRLQVSMLSSFFSALMGKGVAHVLVLPNNAVRIDSKFHTTGTDHHKCAI